MTNCEYNGAFLARDNHVFNGPLHSVARYVLSLAPLTPLTRSAALHFPTLALLPRSVHGLAHSLRSLPHGTVDIHKYVFALKTRLAGMNAFFVFTRNTPNDQKHGRES